MANETSGLPDEVRDYFDAQDHFRDLIDIQLHHVTSERVTGTVQTRLDHQQPMGIVHGGVYCSIVETLASYGANAKALASGCLAVGVANRTDFIRMHQTGPLAGEASIVHADEDSQFWNVNIVGTERNKLVAKGEIQLRNLSLESWRGDLPAELEKLRFRLANR